MTTTSTRSTTIGEQLRAARLRSGYCQGELAGLIGVSQAAIGQWERNTTSPRDRNMVALVGAVGPLTTDMSTSANRPASVTTTLLNELLAAEVIICTMLTAMTSDQKLAIAAKLDALGVAGEGATRFHERRAAITAAGAA